ncbi:MAG: ATP synthase subunit I [Actinobacteria bacterium]|nr:ATP synthase subunit I [Actinomycetota bacterium]
MTTVASTPDPMTTRLEGEAPEITVSLDILKRGAYVSPIIVAVCAVFAGLDGVWSALYAVALVLLNFFFAAGLVALTARISLGLMMGAVLFGYLARLGLIFLAVILVRDASWISLPALGFTIIVTHLGLLVWEMRYVAASLAFPALKPRKP